ncbi:hypothetical protein GDO78_014993 [Eleutherodactylus coqui]|uniref:THAP-type domain-containing protein n=1 Tax=Eleutherodactylus coqui TaxID=57060 RepID=A0A8J6E8P0_ELECQ|nr:hypothetical protein GDO78_014993 [Eleutherodactylus coqui]
MPACLVKDCQSGCLGTEDLCGVTLHAFPTSIERIKQWLQRMAQFLNLNELAGNLLQAAENNTCYLCSRHFSPDSYMVVGQRRYLKAEAVPSIFPAFQLRKVEDLPKPNFKHQRREDGAAHCSCRCTRRDAQTQTEESWLRPGHLSSSSVSLADYERRLDSCHRLENNPQVLSEDRFMSSVDTRYAGRGSGELACLNPAVSKETPKSGKSQETSPQSFPPQLDFIKRTRTIEKDHNHLTKEILRLALKIIYLLSGEEHTDTKKSSGECESPRSSPLMLGGCRTKSAITEPPRLRCRRDKDGKILELSNKIIELLTGEVRPPGRMGDIVQ